MNLSYERLINDVVLFHGFDPSRLVFQAGGADAGSIPDADRRLLSAYIRSSHTAAGEARSACRGAHSRVNSNAANHRGEYRSGAGNEQSADKLNTFLRANSDLRRESR